MDEHQFDSMLPFRSFRGEDANRMGRATSLALGLWGQTSEYLRRQLLAPSPQIPSGFDLADFRELRMHAQIALSLTRENKRHPLEFLPPVVIGTQRLTAWEARCEIVRRSIEFLEKR